MTSSESRWVALDQIRALAAFLVFTWHFAHGAGWEGTPSPRDGAPIVPFAALFDEGHVGVALFMCLSGYLFARLLDGRSIHYPSFALARVIRLFPLLGAMFALRTALVYVHGEPMTDWLKSLVLGLIFPVWPSGAWSITVELQFYLLLPFLLVAQRRHPASMPIVVGLAVLLRAATFWQHGSVQELAYWTIFGRIDQFILGICAYQYRSYFVGNWKLAILCASALALGYYAFDLAGGYYELDGYPSKSPVWVLLPTFDGLLFSALIAWYDNTYSPQGRIARFIARIGFYSYGIYILHFFFVFRLSSFVDQHVVSLKNFYLAWGFAVPCFVLMLIPAWLAYHVVEKPFQRFKPRYARRAPETVAQSPAVLSAN